MNKLVLLCLLSALVVAAERNQTLSAKRGLRRLETPPVLTPLPPTGISPNDPIPDPYNYTCTRDERIAGRCRWCNRDFPSANGMWSGIPPYWQFPGKCSNQAFDVEDTRKCLKGRTVYAIGNSVGRQVPFNLVEMLGGGLVKREDQRDQCPKHETTWDDSCHSEIAGVKLKYLFLQYMDGARYVDRDGFPFFRYKVTGQNNVWQTGKIAYNETQHDGTILNRYYDNPHELDADHDDPLWMDDNCINHSMRECLAKFFKGSTERDILVFTLGMTYGQAMAGKEPTQSPGIDWEKWMIASAGAFKAHLAATFKGQIFRITHAEFNSNSNIAHKSPNLQKANAALWNVWQPSSDDTPWYTIDQWPINQNRYYLYNDHVHFNGPLTHAAIHQVLNELCPGGGKTTWLHPGAGRNITDAFRAMAQPLIIKTAISRNSMWYKVLLNGTRHNIPDMDTLAGLEVPDSEHVVVTAFDLEYLPEGEPLVPCDPAWTSQLCKTSVYYKAFHHRPY